MPARLLVALVALATLTALPALAAPRSPADVRAALAGHNDELKRALSTLAGGYGQDLQAEERRIEQAAALAAKVQQGLTEDLQVAAEAHQAVQQNLAALRGELERARAAHRVAALEQEVRAAHAAGTAVEEQKLVTLQQAVASLRSRAGEGWQDTVAHFEERAARLEQDRATLLALAAKAEAAAAEKAQSGALDEAFRAANRERRRLDAFLEGQEAPLPEELLRTYLAAANRVSALSERAGRYYTTLYRHFLVTSAFRTGTAKLPAELASLYQGALLDDGRSRKGRLLARFLAEEDWCYALVARLSRAEAGAAIGGSEWSAQSKGALLVRFDVPHAGPGYQLTEGVCPTKSTRLTFKAELQGAAKDNAARYAVVGWPRQKMPAFVASYARVLVDDRCDDALWQAAWTRPVPGSLVWREGEPFLVAAAERPDRDEVTLLDADGGRHSVSKGAIASKAPEKRRSTTTFTWRGCPAASAPEAAGLAGCLEGVEKRYRKDLEREQTRVESASSDEAREKAEAALSGLRAKQRAEREKRCDPLEARLRESVRRSFDRILDAYAEGPVPVVVDRADQLQAEQEARPALR